MIPIYEVSVEIFPWKTPLIIGRYKSLEVANRVSIFSIYLFYNRIQGGAKISCDPVYTKKTSILETEFTPKKITERVNKICERFPVFMIREK